MKVTLKYNTPPELLGDFAAICWDSDGCSEKRLKHIVKVGHYSVLRFGMVVFQITGISRVCAMQLIRHKHLDYLMRSSRYCDESECDFIWPDVVDAEKTNDMESFFRELYKQAIDVGMKKEDARYLLPQAQETAINIAGNYQAWMDFVNLRTSKSTQLETRLVAFEIQRQLREIAPIIFGEAEEPETDDCGRIV